jgi:hypothetical protein
MVDVAHIFILKFREHESTMLLYLKQSYFDILKILCSRKIRAKGKGHKYY